MEEASKTKEEITLEDTRYLAGAHNKAIRFYYYLERGLDILNIFRNLFLGIITAYIALKLTSPIWAVAMGLVSIVILILVGWYNVHTLSKMKEWLNIRFSTHYGIKTFDYTKRQVELLEEIKRSLDELNGKGWK